MTAWADDSHALFYNPAGLAQMTASELRMPDLMHVNVSPSVVDLYNQIQSIEGGDGVSGISAALRKFDGRGFGFGLDTVGFGYFRRRMAIMLNLFSVNASFRVRTPSILFVRVTTRATIDSALTLGYAAPLGTPRLRGGVAVRPVMIRGGLSRDFVGTEIQDIGAGALSYGWGSDFDAGLQYDVWDFSVKDFKAQIKTGIVLQNILATKFSQKLPVGTGTSEPPQMDRRINWGVALQGYDLGPARPTLTFELRDLLVKTDSWLEHVHAAFEFRLQPKSWYVSTLRTHFAKGNVGGGLAGRFWVGEMEIGTYAVNLGKGPGVGRDRRSYLALSAVW